MLRIYTYLSGLEATFVFFSAAVETKFIMINILILLAGFETLQMRSTDPVSELKYPAQIMCLKRHKSPILDLG